jgi:hypothetical protein
LVASLPLDLRNLNQLVLNFHWRLPGGRWDALQASKQRIKTLHTVVNRGNFGV